MIQWQLIETAPKDRTPIVGFVPPLLVSSDGLLTLGMAMKILRFKEGGWRCDMAHTYYPTHWMPLPPPPTVEHLAAPQPTNTEQKP